MHKNIDITKIANRIFHCVNADNTSCKYFLATVSGGICTASEERYKLHFDSEQNEYYKCMPCYLLILDALAVTIGIIEDKIIEE